MEIDLAAVPRQQESVALRRESSRHPRGMAGIVLFDGTALQSRVRLQLSTCGIESVADRDVHLFVGVVLVRVAVHVDFASRHPDLDVQPVQLAFVVVRVRASTTTRQLMTWP